MSCWKVFTHFGAVRCAERICFVADVIAYNKRVGCVSRDFYSVNENRHRFLRDHKIGGILIPVTRMLDERSLPSLWKLSRHQKKPTGYFMVVIPRRTCTQETAQFTTADHPAYGERRSFHALLPKAAPYTNERD